MGARHVSFNDLMRATTLFGSKSYESSMTSFVAGIREKLRGRVCC
jgi:hypothetical protein